MRAFTRAVSRRRNSSALTRPVRAVVELMEGRRLMSTNSWKAAVSGDWDTAANWSLKHVPTASEDAVISVSGSYTVTHSTGTADSVKSLTTSKPLTFSAGSLSVASTFTATSTVTLQGGTIIGGTLTAGSGGSFLIAGGPTFQGVTLGSNLTVPASSTLYVQKSLNLNGHNLTLSSTVSGAGTLYFEALSGESTGPSLTGTGSVLLAGTTPANNIIYAYDYLHPTTIASTVTVAGAGNIYVGYASPGGLNNAGKILANTSGATLFTGGAGTLSNTGTLSATGGGTLTLNGVWTNSATLSETNSTLNLGGSFSHPGVVTKSGGNVNLTGIYNAAGGTAAFTSTTGTWNLEGGTLENATITQTSGSGIVIPTGEYGTFINVTLGGDLTIPASSTLYLQQKLTLNGHTLTLASSSTGSATLYIQALSGESTGASLAGTGTVNLGGSTPANNIVYAYDYLHPVTIASGVTVAGAGNIYVGYASPGGLNNAGKITANISGQTLTTSGAGTLNNTGTLSATGGGILTLNGNWTNSATLSETNSTLNLGGTVTHTGVVTKSGGNVNLTGVYNLSGGTAAFTATTGTWNLVGGTLENAVITETAGSGLVLPAGDYGTFLNLTLGGDFTIPASSTLYLQQKLTLNGHTLTLASSSTGSATLYVQALSGESSGASLAGTGTVNLGGTTPANNIVYAYDYLHPMSIASGVTVSGAGNIYVGYASPGGLNNAGKISASTNGQTLTTSGAGTLSNTGTLSATGGGTLTLNGTWTNSATLSETSSTLNLGGTFSHPGVVTKSGGNVNLTGVYNASGATAAFTATTGTWNLAGGTLENAVITETAGTGILLLAGQSGTFLNVTLGGDFTIPASSTLYEQQALNLNGHTLTLAASSSGSATLYIQALSGESTGASLAGTGIVKLAGTTPANNIVYAYDYLHAVSIGSNVTLQGVGAIYVGYAAPGGLTNNGTILANVSGQTLTMSGAGPFTNKGTINISSGATLSISNATWSNASGGTITGTGKLVGNVTNAGTIAAGAPLFGTLIITGNLTETSTGIIRVELGGSSSSSYNKLAVSGSATLAGLLDIYTVGSYVPSSGTSFSVVTFGSKTGTVATDGTSLSSSIALSETLGSKSITLKAISASSDSTAPTVSAFTTSSTTTSASTFTFTVTYADNVAISIASLGNGNLKVTGPGGFSAFATLVSVSKSNNGTPRSAVYSISTSKGSGTYTVTAVASSVKDTKGNALAAGKIGSFVLTKK